eukprot:TRINITY_DN9186_c0_g1_i1.p1 TRINITY_DN9186_c0_g1~~TRINITY_DN9186_c0_g1_i1.p1  ORF type:complete len:1893 (-),score=358.04 TRINITY_DN9186_c0_g1_i1:217-5541(-)
MTPRSFLGKPCGHRNVGFQAADDEERQRWITAIDRALHEVGQRKSAEARAKREAAQAKQAAGAAEDVGAGVATGSAPASSSSSTPAAGQGSPNPVAKGKGKAPGKGKMPPPPPPPGGADGEFGAAGGAKAKGKGPGKGKGGASSSTPKNVLPFGRRLYLGDAGVVPATAVPFTPRGTQVCGSIFNELLDVHETRKADDIEVLKSVFTPLDATKRNSLAEKGAARAARLGAGKKDEVTVFSQKEAQNLGIVIRTLPRNGADFMEALRDLEPGAYDAEQLQRLLEVLPSPERLAALVACQAPPGTLRDVEKTVLPWAGIERMQQRIQVLCIATRFEGIQERLIAQLRVVEAACADLRNSRTLREVLGTVLVMFNYANFGVVTRTEARAFDITTLLRLNEFKTTLGPFAAFNGLHFVAMRLLAASPDMTVDRLNEEMRHLSDAVQASLSDISSALKALQADAEFLRSEQMEHPTAYGGRPKPPARKHADSGNSTRSSFLKRRGPAPNRRATMHAGDLDEERASFLEKAKPRKRDLFFDWARRLIHREPGTGRLSPRGLERVPMQSPRDVPKPTVLVLGESSTATGIVLWERKVRVAVVAPGLLWLADAAGPSAAAAKTVCVVVAGASVEMLSSPLATPEAREQAEDRKSAFELQNVDIKGDHYFAKDKRLWLDAKNPAEASRWYCALRGQSEAQGAGYLWVKRSAGMWHRRWVVWHGANHIGRAHSSDSVESVDGCQLMQWYHSPVDMLRGDPPVGSLLLDGDARQQVHTFMEKGRSEAAKRPFGFEVASGSMLTYFCAASRADMERWVTLLRGSDDQVSVLSSPRTAFQNIFSWMPGSLEAAANAAKQETLGPLSWSPHGSSNEGSPRDGLLRTPRGSTATPLSAGCVPPMTPRGPPPRDIWSGAPASFQPAEPLSAVMTPRSRNTSEPGSLSPTDRGGQETGFGPGLPRIPLMPVEEESNTPKTRQRRRTMPASWQAEAPAEEASLRQTRSFTQSVYSDSSDNSDSDYSTDSDTSSSDSSSDSQPEGQPIRQLTTLIKEIETAVAQLDSSLCATTTDCRQLLTYFAQGVNDASAISLANQVQGFFSTLMRFWLQLCTALADVSKHRQACLRRGQLDPVKSMGAGKLDKENSALAMLNFETPPTRKQSKPASWREQINARKAAKAYLPDLIDRVALRVQAKLLVERVVTRSLTGECRVDSCSYPAAAGVASACVSVGDAALRRLTQANFSAPASVPSVAKLTRQMSSQSSQGTQHFDLGSDDEGLPGTDAEQEEDPYTPTKAPDNTPNTEEAARKKEEPSERVALPWLKLTQSLCEKIGPADGQSLSARTPPRVRSRVEKSSPFSPVRSARRSRVEHFDISLDDGPGRARRSRRCRQPSPDWFAGEAAKAIRHGTTGASGPGLEEPLPEPPTQVPSPESRLLLQDSPMSPGHERTNLATVLEDQDGASAGSSFTAPASPPVKAGLGGRLGPALSLQVPPQMPSLITPRRAATQLAAVASVPLPSDSEDELESSPSSVCTPRNSSPSSVCTPRNASDSNESASPPASPSRPAETARPVAVSELAMAFAKRAKAGQESDVCASPAPTPTQSAPTDTPRVACTPQPMMTPPKKSMSEDDSSAEEAALKEMPIMPKEIIKPLVMPIAGGSASGSWSVSVADGVEDGDQASQQRGKNVKELLKRFSWEPGSAKKSPRGARKSAPGKFAEEEPFLRSASHDGEAGPSGSLGSEVPAAAPLQSLESFLGQSPPRRRAKQAGAEQMREKMAKARAKNLMKETCS